MATRPYSETLNEALRDPRDAGVGRESLYKTVSEDGNPELSTLTALLHSLGLRLSVIPESNKRTSASAH